MAAFGYRKVKPTGEMPAARGGFRLPFRYTPVEITQGYNGPWSHFPMESNFTFGGHSYAIDFKLPLGTEIAAAKRGKIVVAIGKFSDYYDGEDYNRGIELSFRTNFILIRHEDGTFASYLHLAQNSALAREGEMIEQGQPLAYTGKSGWIGPVPHLHFEPWMREEAGKQSFPVVFEDYDGLLEHAQIFPE